MSKIKKKSRILEAVYETASDLHACGLLNDERMNEYKEMCLEPVTLYLEKDVIDYLNKKCGFNAEKLHNFINELLRKNLDEIEPTAVI